MAFKNNRAFFRQPLRNAGMLQIRAGDFISKRKQDLGNTAHADAADAYEMDTLNFCKHLRLCRFAAHRLRASPTFDAFLHLMQRAYRARRVRPFICPTARSCSRQRYKSILADCRLLAANCFPSPAPLPSAPLFPQRHGAKVLVPAPTFPLDASDHQTAL